ncbi:hypothetical protein [Allorhodopirellula solitaria]|uniref:Uncharacterized protein n=1 Tax=Allorhodopirellula solitaria TaxID=2527987 RepID=A0A5C5YJS3_9BACT|nr:hypothetical protein [Allorhodopirellula solitaria]TWT75146.1 hypothetical protein CA85_04350 [Allorhodopirellula solitaria]
MKWNWISIALVACLAGWRGLWLAAGVPDTTATADRVRQVIETQIGSTAAKEANDTPWRVSFAPVGHHTINTPSSFEIVPVGTDLWDASLPVWITPGRDRQPGWAGWDDNDNGEIDDSGELGAAWSDDFCVVQMPADPAPDGRVLDHGAFRPLPPNDEHGAIGEGRVTHEAGAIRQRFDVRYIRDAP